MLLGGAARSRLLQEGPERGHLLRMRALQLRRRHTASSDLIPRPSPQLALVRLAGTARNKNAEVGCLSVVA